MEIKKTALFNVHKQLGAKLIEFAGYYMPVMYKGIMDEHVRVRKTVGLFDVSHMGEFEISGTNAERFLQKMTINDVAALNDYQVQYSAMCYEDGGIVDDLLVYKYPDRYFMVVNAANLEKDFNWLQDHLEAGVNLNNRSDEFSLLALQGRFAEAIIQKLTTAPVAEINTYWFKQTIIAGAEVMLARTGYTGEDGFEIMVANEKAVAVWNAIMEAGKQYEIDPVGLGARDTLRLEVRYCLYGNDIDHTTNPLEAGLGWITKLKKGDFIGRDVIAAVKENGLKRKLIGFEVNGKAFPRKGYDIFSGEQKIGFVTSGSFSPILEKSIGTGYVAIDFARSGTPLEIEIRGKRIAATVVKPPFYKRPY